MSEKSKKKKPAASKAAGKKKSGTKQKKRLSQKSKRKNVSQKVPNGKFVISNDRYFYGTDGKSDKTRMGTVVDSNRKDELAIVKYTTSTRHGNPFANEKGFFGHGDKIYTMDNEGNPIKIDSKKFSAPGRNRDITEKQANEIKRWNLTESRYKAGNRTNLKKLKDRKQK